MRRGRVTADLRRSDCCVGKTYVCVRRGAAAQAVDAGVPNTAAPALPFTSLLCIVAAHGRCGDGGARDGGELVAVLVGGVAADGGGAKRALAADRAACGSLQDKQPQQQQQPQVQISVLII